MPSFTKVQTGFLEAINPFTLDIGTASAPGLKFSDSSATGGGGGGGTRNTTGPDNGGPGGNGGSGIVIIAYPS